MEVIIIDWLELMEDKERWEVVCAKLAEITEKL